MNIDITLYLEKLKVTKEQNEKEYKNQRDELVKKTVATLKEERRNWKPGDEINIVSEKTVAIMFNKKFGGDNYSLYIFLTKCKNSNSFSYTFWSAFKK